MSWYTTAQIADALGVSRRTVARDIAAGVIEATCRPTGGGRTRIRVHVEALREFARYDPALRARVEAWIVASSTRNQQAQQAQ
ncbi:MAG: helix-turn-helix domain-containing protein [Vicinamibacterales bacterium]